MLEQQVQNLGQTPSNPGTEKPKFLYENAADEPILNADKNATPPNNQPLLARISASVAKIATPAKAASLVLGLAICTAAVLSATLLTLPLHLFAGALVLGTIGLALAIGSLLSLFAKDETKVVVPNDLPPPSIDFSDLATEMGT